MVGVFQLLLERWQHMRPTTRAMLQASAWLVSLLVLGLAFWQPGQIRLQLAEQALLHEQALSSQLQQLEASPARFSAQRLSPGRMSEQALAAGVQVSAMQTQERRVQMSVEGKADDLLQWLHVLERDGAQLMDLRLRAGDGLLHAQLNVELDEAAP